MFLRACACSVLLLAFGLLGCTSCRDDAQGTGSSASASAAASPVASVTSSASPASSARARMVLEDLLHFTDATIGVSSKVQNPHDHPEDIADGRLETAWNGKTDDLVGAWFGFRVPSATRVKRIEVVAGFSSKSKKGEDLFTMNHRIARVRVERDGKPLLETGLNPDERGLQAITLDAPGGDFKIVILDVVPGTKMDWREIAVSELRVLGVAGAAKHERPTMPRARVGGFDAPPPFSIEREKGAFDTLSAATPETVCSRWMTRAHELDERFRSADPAPPYEAPTPSCSVQEVRRDGTRAVLSPVSQGTTDTPRLLLFSLVDVYSTHARLGASYGGKTYVFGEPAWEKFHLAACTDAGRGGSIRDARIEPGGPPTVATFDLYVWSRSDSVADVELPDGRYGPGEGESERKLTQVRCGLEPAGPECTTTTTRHERGTAKKPGLETAPSSW
jgi:hypothetical protein